MVAPLPALRRGGRANKFLGGASLASLATAGSRDVTITDGATKAVRRDSVEDLGKVQWAPRVYMWDGGWLGLGPGRGVVPPHRHHAVQVSVALEAEVRLRAPGTDWRVYRGAIVRPDTDHSLAGHSELTAFLLIDPDCHEGRWIGSTLRDEITAIPDVRLEPCMERLRRIWDDPPPAEDLARLIATTVHGLCAGPPPILVLDDRILRALEIIRTADAAGLPLESVAKQVYLSPSRFAHLFTEQVGLPYRRYLLWRKLNLAMTVVRRGATLSAAAHLTGFADSAHLTRTFRQMFGIPPTQMISRGEVYEIPAPFEVLTSRAPVSTVPPPTGP